MRDKIELWKGHVRELSGQATFVHHEWFVRWHLEVVERIAFELCDKYPAADRELVEVMVWLHDYGKILNFDDQYNETLSSGRVKLTEMGFTADFVERAVTGIETMDKKMELDLREASLEVQIVATADGCSHMVGPFLSLYWREHPGLTTQELMAANRAKLEKDWTRKITLPEARSVFAARYDFLSQQFSEDPNGFLET
ncbi:HD domain-containing protein [Candidatus Saccharibacteria bacterium]|nr:MAG: HD domain-containing protein [Candidatus Saccharibacteria bacterium]